MMLPPTQQASATTITAMMRSVLDDIEERRIAEEEKRKGDKDKAVKALVTPDEVASAANARINEHFFGALKSDENPMAVLAARFIAATGLTQEAGESTVDFGTRLGDVVYFADFVTKQYSNGKPMEVGLKAFQVSEATLTATVEGTAEQPTAAAQFLARFVVRNGLEQADGETDLSYGVRMGDALTEARKSVPSSVAQIEAKSGLRDLGVTAKQMVEAIKQPYGETAQKIKAILDDKAAENNFTTADMSKVLQRLEEVADPKTIEELKADRVEKDPTRVEDAETRQEREATIQSLEAVEKLEDVQKVQDALADRNEAAGGGGTPTSGETGKDSDPAIGALETIQILAAGAELAVAKTESKGAQPQTDAPADAATGTVEPGTRPTDDQQAVMLARAGTPEGDTASETGKDILLIDVDENGIYALLKRDKAA